MEALFYSCTALFIVEMEIKSLAAITWCCQYSVGFQESIYFLTVSVYTLTVYYESVEFVFGDWQASWVPVGKHVLQIPFPLLLAFTLKVLKYSNAYNCK